MHVAGALVNLARALPIGYGETMTTAPRTTAIMIDGAFVAPGDPARLVLDDGLVRGDGVFEGIRIYGRRPRTPDAHLDRLALSASNIDLPIDLPLLRREFAQFCAGTSEEDCGVRLMLTRGGRRIWREEPVKIGRAHV